MDFLFDTALYIIVPTLLLIVQRQSRRINQLSVKASKLQAASNINAQTPEDKLDSAFQVYEELCSCLPVDEQKQSCEELVTVQEPSEDFWQTVEVEDTVVSSKNEVVPFSPAQKEVLLLAPAAPSLPTESAGCAVLDLNQLSVRELRAMCKNDSKYQGYSKYAKKGKKALIKFMMGC